MASDIGAEVDRVTDLALALSPAARELVAFRIWESLRPDENWPLSAEQGAEIRRRAAEIDARTAALVDGDEALRAARARIEARQR